VQILTGESDVRLVSATFLKTGRAGADFSSGGSVKMRMLVFFPRSSVRP
jgi:hypothetical protein